ncbi:MAG: SH3 domain-containing protein [Candidatus Aquicultor sp.]
MQNAIKKFLDDAKNNNLNNTIVRHVTAWFLLLMVGIFLWKMSQPIINNISPKSGQEATATALSVETTASITAKGKTVKAPVKAPAKTVVAGTTTTTGLQNMRLPSGQNRVQVLVEALNVRQAPDIKSAVVTSISKGSIVEVEESNGQWLKIRTVDNNQGYISSSPALVRAAP